MKEQDKDALISKAEVLIGKELLVKVTEPNSKKRFTKKFKFINVAAISDKMIENGQSGKVFWSVYGLIECEDGTKITNMDVKKIIKGINDYDSTQTNQ